LGGSGNIVLVMNAIETTGVVDAQHQLRLDKPLPIAGHSRVRVIVLVPDEADISEAAWTETVATSITLLRGIHENVIEFSPATVAEADPP